MFSPGIFAGVKIDAPIFPKDKIHVYMCKFVSFDKIDKGLFIKNNFFKLSEINPSQINSAENEKTIELEFFEQHLSDWKIQEIYEPSDDSKILKMCKFRAVSFVNEKKKQLVLAFKGFNCEFDDIIKRKNEIFDDIKGILFQGLLPQLFRCFEITEEVCELAYEKSYVLSFTGYSNGAWLAEYALHFAHIFDLYITKCKLKAVIFDSPGIFRGSDELAFKLEHKQYNYNRENVLDNNRNIMSFRAADRDDHQLEITENIVNYLLKPSLGNSFNKHYGKTYRIFDNSKKEEEKTEQIQKNENTQADETRRKFNVQLESFLERIKKKVGFNDNFEMLKTSDSFLEDCQNILDPDSIDKFLDAFKREDCLTKQKVIKWPLLKISLGNKFKNNLKKMVDMPLERLINLIPVPNLSRVPTTLLLRFTFSCVTNIITENALPGLHVIINVLYQIVQTNAEFLKFVSLIGIQPLPSDVQNNNIENLFNDKLMLGEFSLILNNNYKLLDNFDKILSIKKGTIDYFLYDLCSPRYFTFNRSQKINTDLMGNLVECLDIVDGIYLKFKKNNTFETLDELEDYFIFNLDQNPNIFNKENRKKLSDLEDLRKNIPSVLPKIKSDLIDRLNIFSELDNIFLYNKFTIIRGESGVGKTTLALQFYQYISNNFFSDYHSFVVRFFDCDKTEKIYQAFNEIAGDFEKKFGREKKTKKLNRRIFEYHLDDSGSDDEDNNTKKLSKIYNYIGNQFYTETIFIFDNLQYFSYIEDYLLNLPRNLKILITTRSSDIEKKLSSLFKNQVKTLNLENFYKFEAEKFIKSNLENFSKEEKEMVFNKLFEKKSSITGLNLELAIKYVKDNAENTFKFHVYRFIKTKNSSEIIKKLFKNLDSDSNEYKLLRIIKLFDNKFISFRILIELSDLTYEDLIKTTKILEYYGLVNSTERYGKLGISFHDEVLHELKIFFKQDYFDKFFILTRILKFFQKKFKSKDTTNDSNASLVIDQLKNDLKEKTPVINRLEEKILDFIKYKKDSDSERNKLNHLWEEFYYHMLAMSESNEIDQKLAINKFMNKEEIFNSIKDFEPKNSFIVETSYFTRFASDLVHLLMCKDVYEEYHDMKKESKEKINFNGEDWIVSEVYKEHTQYLEMCTFKAVVYTNNARRQMVVAFKGLQPKLKDIFNKEGGLKNNLEAIFLNGTTAQLIKCFQVADASYFSAKNRNYNLSFTGFSNGAWLAENAINFIPEIDKNYNPSKIKAILFDSHGITKEKENIKKKDHDKMWELSDNITCYLSNPNFANSCNIHHGHVFRIFIEYKDEKFEKETEILSQIQSWVSSSKNLFGLLGKIGIFKSAGSAVENAVSIGSNAVDSVINNKVFIKNLKFILAGLKSLFNPELIDKFIEQFNKDTGKPEYYEKVIVWPLVKVKLNKDYKQNFENLIQKPINVIAGFIPYPDYIKTPAAIAVNIIFSKLLNTITDHFLPGAHLIINILYELWDNNIDFTVLDDASFNIRITDGKKIHCLEKDSKKALSEQIDLRAICKYKTQSIDDTKKKLKPRCYNIDWYLFHLTKSMENLELKIKNEKLNNLNKDKNIKHKYKNIDFEKLKKIVKSYHLHKANNTIEFKEDDEDDDEDSNKDQNNAKNSVDDKNKYMNRKNNVFKKNNEYVNKKFTSLEMVIDSLIEIVEDCPKLKDFINEINHFPTKNINTKDDLVFFKTELIDRKRILVTIDNKLFNENKIVALSGPSGLGKTSLVIQYREYVLDYNKINEVIFIQSDNREKIYLALQKIGKSLKQTHQYPKRKNPFEISRFPSYYYGFGFYDEEESFYEGNKDYFGANNNNYGDKIDLEISEIFTYINLSRKSYLFIFDNVENLEDLSDFIKEIPKNSKIILTSCQSEPIKKFRDDSKLNNNGSGGKNLIETELEVIELEEFKKEDTEEYVREQLDMLKTDDREKIINILFNGENTISGLKLDLILKYAKKEEYANNLEKLFRILNNNTDTIIIQEIINEFDADSNQIKFLKTVQYLDYNFISFQHLSYLTDISVKDISILVNNFEKAGVLSQFNKNRVKAFNFNKKIVDELKNNFKDDINLFRILFNKIEKVLLYQIIDNNFDKNNEYFHHLLAVQKCIKNENKLKEFIPRMDEISENIKKFKEKEQVTERENENREQERRKMIEERKKFDHERRKNFEKSRSILNNFYDPKYDFGLPHNDELSPDKNEFESIKNDNDNEIDEEPVKLGKNFEGNLEHVKIDFETGKSKFEINDYSNAIEKFEICLRNATESIIEAGVSVPLLLNYMIKSYLNLGDDKRVIEIFDTELEKRKTLYDNQQLASLYNDVGLAYSNFGNNEKAIEIYKSILDFKLDESDTLLGVAYSRMSKSYNYNNDMNNARECIKKAFDILNQKEKGETGDLAEAYLVEASILFKSKKNNIDKAIKNCQRSLEIYKKLFGEDHNYTANALRCLGKLLLSKGDLYNSKVNLKRSRLIMKNISLTNTPLYAKILNNLGMAYLKYGHHKKSKKCFEMSFDVCKAVLPQTHKLMVSVENNLNSLVALMNQKIEK